jgi:peptidoglycan hydrolase-like protein with peptidoglycan-binding domain
MIGSATNKALASGKAVNINDYAVLRAVVAIQREVGADPDGIFGPDTGKKLTAWQSSHGVGADGVFGQGSSKAMFMPMLERAVKSIENPHKDLLRVARGHTWSESSLDPGCVGPSTPEDLGLCQINGRWHPDMTAEARLDPDTALRWQANFVQQNIASMSGNVRDGIAAYLLGVGGAKQWVGAGRPDVWTRVIDVGQGVKQNVSTPVKQYVDTVWANGAL